MIISCELKLVCYDYLGPKRWGEHYELCDNGTMQSPIDLRTNKTSANGIPKIDDPSIFSESFVTEDAEGNFSTTGIMAICFLTFRILANIPSI